MNGSSNLPQVYIVFCSILASMVLLLQSLLFMIFRPYCPSFVLSSLFVFLCIHDAFVPLWLLIIVFFLTHRKYICCGIGYFYNVCTAIFLNLFLWSVIWFIITFFQLLCQFGHLFNQVLTMVNAMIGFSFPESYCSNG